jgi:hypothetical protein
MWYSFKESYVYYMEIIDFPENTFGFIYRITHVPSKRYYIGKKFLYHSIKKKLTKKEIAEQTGPGRKSLTKTIQKESDWKSYWGSSKEFLELVKKYPEEEFKKEIIYIVANKKLLTYYEVKAQLENNCLQDSLCYVDNVLGKFYKKDFISLES